MITSINEFKKFNHKKIDIQPNSNGYQYLGGSSKYLIVSIRGMYRIENYNGIYKEEVPYIDIPKNMGEHWLDLLSYYKDEEKNIEKMQNWADYLNLILKWIKCLMKNTPNYILN